MSNNKELYLSVGKEVHFCASSFRTDRDPIDMPDSFYIEGVLPDSDKVVASMTGYLFEREYILDAADACDATMEDIAEKLYDQNLALDAKYVNRAGRKACFIDELFVEPELRKQGLATIVLANLRAMLCKIEPSLCGIYAYVDDDCDDELFKFFEKHGFCRIDDSRVIWIPIPDEA